MVPTASLLARTTCRTWLSLLQPCCPPANPAGSRRALPRGSRLAALRSSLSCGLPATPRRSHCPVRPGCPPGNPLGNPAASPQSSHSGAPADSPQPSRPTLLGSPQGSLQDNPRGNPRFVRPCPLAPLRMCLRAFPAVFLRGSLLAAPASAGQAPSVGCSRRWSRSSPRRLQHRHGEGSTSAAPESVSPDRFQPCSARAKRVETLASVTLPLLSRT